MLSFYDYSIHELFMVLRFDSSAYNISSHITIPLALVQVYFVKDNLGPAFCINVFFSTP